MLYNVNILVRGSSGRIGKAICNQIESHMTSYQKSSPTYVGGSLTLYSQNPLFATLIIIASGNSDNSSDKNVCRGDTENLMDFLNFIWSNKLAKENDELILISSGGTVYGNSTTVITETAEFNPKTYYAQEKILQENFMSKWAQERGVKAYIFRLANVYALDSPRPKGLIETAIHSFGRGIRMNITSKYDSSKQYGSSYDYAHWILRTWRQIQELPGVSIVNIFASNIYSVETILDKISQYLSMSNARTDKTPLKIQSGLDTVILGTIHNLDFLNGSWDSLEASLRSSSGICHCVVCNQLPT